MKTVLITGANKSIGFETAKQMLADGYFVYLGSRDLAKGEEAAKKLISENIKVVAIDISDKKTIDAAHATVEADGKGLDILINNAGISGAFPQTAAEGSVEVIREVFDTNFFGTINMCQAFLDLLKNADEPRIVNVTSGLGSLTMHSDPDWKYYQVKSAAYGTSKTALNAYTVVLAYELRDTNFKVNVVDPGYTATDFNDHRGPGSVEDAAKIIVKYATVGADGPTGMFFSNDSDSGDEKLPW
jgi:NAD(P)-dependent dehydrogenase (short-subunit alcohol dehydrogenase family)